MATFPNELRIVTRSDEDAPAPVSAFTGQSRRSRTLASLVRAAMLEGETLVAFYVSALLNKELDMSHRMEAGKWLTERGWGKAPDVVENYHVGQGELVIRYVNDWRNLDALPAPEENAG